MTTPSFPLNRGVTAFIDLAALRHNVGTLASLTAPSAIMLAVKADAYGHGLIPIAKAGLVAGASSLAVLEISAGLELRAAGITEPLFAWLHGQDTDFRAGIEAGIELGISARWQIDAILASQATIPARIHMKVDSGLSRNGATVDEWPYLIDAALHAERMGAVHITGAWSHLADTSVEEDSAARAVFLSAVETATSRGAHFDVLHLAASSAGIRMPEARFDLVRFGIAAYGISPFSDRTGSELGLIPVMTLATRVTEIIRDGRTLARLDAGYADGIHTTGIGQSQVLIDGKRRPIVSVGVDSTLVDIGNDLPGPGGEAIIFGNGSRGEPTAEEWAQWSQTVADEIVTHPPKRVRRVYLHE